MVNHKYKFIFIHIPKCAGTTIKGLGILHPCESLMNISTKKNAHPQYEDIKKYLGNQNIDINDYFKFSFTRNPWSWRVSHFEYAKKMHRNNLGIYGSHQYSKLKNLSFKDFIKTHGDFLQFDYLSNMKNELSVDFVGKFENLKEDFNIVCDKIGIPRQQLPHANKSKHKHYTEYYDEETKELVAKKYAKDIEYFGYEFGD